MKRLILGMSKSRRDLADWIEDRTPQVMIALIQLYLFPHGNRVHWRKEVWEKFFEMKRLSGSAKLPTVRFILENSWEINKHSIPNMIRFVIGKEEEYSPGQDIDENELYELIENYFRWLAEKLSKDVFLPKQDVLAKLDELGLVN